MIALRSGISGAGNANKVRNLDCEPFLVSLGSNPAMVKMDTTPTTVITILAAVVKRSLSLLDEFRDPGFDLLMCFFASCVGRSLERIPFLAMDLSGVKCGAYPFSNTRGRGGRVGYGGRSRSLVCSTDSLAKAEVSRITSRSFPLYSLSLLSNFLRL